jgi:hypothetical protein
MMQVRLCGEWFFWSAQTRLRFQRGDMYTRKGYAVVAPKAGNPLRSKLRVELTLRGLSPNNTRRPHSIGATP